MEMLFNEVFNTLKLPDELSLMMDEVHVTRACLSNDKSNLRIHISSGHIIERKQLKAVAGYIKKQQFNGKNIAVSFVERYNLSSQYTVSAILKSYFESILDELNEKNRILYEILRLSEITADKSTLKIRLDDSAINKKTESEIKSVITQIFEERLGIPCDIEFSYKPAEKSELDKRREYIEQEQIAEIYTRAKKESGKDVEVAEDKGHAGQVEDTQAADLNAAAERKKSSFRGRENVRSDDKDVFYGRSVDNEYTPISTAVEEQGGFAIRGQIQKVDIRSTRKGSKIFLVDVSDFTDCVTMKLFIKSEKAAEILESNLKEKSFIACEGIFAFDTYDNAVQLVSVTGIKKIPDFRLHREDRAQVKRVELHCHTKLSKMDAVCAPDEVIKRAAAWGHRAVAITDHGVVQGFTDAFHALPKVREKNPDFKIIYGMEGYLVDDLMDVATNVKGNKFDDDFVVFDIETTGFSPVNNNIIEIGAVKISNGGIVDRFSTFVNPKEPVPYNITKLTGITNEMVENAPFISEVLPEFLEFSKDCVFVAHNADFDMGFIKQNAERLSIKGEFTYFDTVQASRILLPNLAKHKLDNVCRALKISLENHHRAVDDAGATALIFLEFMKRFREKGINTLDEVNDFSNNDNEKTSVIKRLRMHHIILLAANEIGRINLYRLVSMSNLKYFHAKQRIPKSELIKHREGLIIGSACEAGELFRAIAENRSESEIRKIAGFYDYLEVQPVGNNEFLIRDKVYENITGIDDIKNINKKIVALGEELCKPVVATTDAHFLDPEDEIYRRIITATEFIDADYQAPLYFKTTEEMLEEFEYLGMEKAYEIVITNSNRICDMIEYIEPVRPDKCPPVIENSDVELKNICYETAKKQYGEDLPKPVKDRLDKELNSIISNGFAVMYIIAQKLVKDSNDQGYVVGSRGSVGSSFVATMSGISEVNPLPPHYFCPNCHYSDFDSDEIKASGGLAGCDMPDKDCPVCGKALKKDGFDIPFETFLGFYGDKEPDIDLNFSSEYQAEAHKYTEVIFGEGNTFKAGTVLTVADKTARGYVWKYYAERGIKKHNTEIDRIANGLTKVKSGTSQHPGGIVVLPHGEEIHTFTPIQHPADKAESDMITTHFDYHSIDHNLLKLDILGHKNPTMIKRFSELTGTDPTTVSLDDKDVLSLFKNTDALNITPEDIGGCKLGCLGIPEFGTDLAMNMLLETNPQSVSDLVRISGLSHGTDVWAGNAQTLIQEGKATISTAICTRDDIMTYLIRMGLDAGDSFQIMENVRKGKVAGGKCKNWAEYKDKMQNASVPDWYIWSCEKIQYMFPKAHAAAYVTMACRIAYYKIHYPLAYYAAYFSILADAFDYEKMCMGIDKVKAQLAELRSRNQNDFSDKEKKEYKDLRIVEEMYARGYEFTPLDIFVADANNCKIVDGKVMPHIASIGGMGATVAEGICAACKDGEFLSKDSFRERSKVSKTIADKMYELGLLGNIPESNQMSIFDFFDIQPNE